MEENIKMNLKEIGINMKNYRTEIKCSIENLG